MLPDKAISVSSDEEEEEDVEDDNESMESGELNEGDASFYMKEPIMLTIKNALVDFLHEIDPNYGDLITFPIFQEFVRSHSSTLVYNNNDDRHSTRNQNANSHILKKNKKTIILKHSLV